MVRKTECSRVSTERGDGFGGTNTHSYFWLVCVDFLEVNLLYKVCRNETSVRVNWDSKLKLHAPFRATEEVEKLRDAEQAYPPTS